MKNLYDILEVKKSSKKDKIKSSYRSKSKIHHPDKGGKPEEFHLITTAYKILMDDDKRSRYDAGENVDDILKAAISDEQKAQNLLMQMFCGIIVNADIKKQNIIKLMRNNLESGIGEVELAMKNEKSKIKKFEEAIKRLKILKGNNIFKDSVMSQIDTISRVISHYESKKKEFTDALNILKNFDYEFEKEPEIVFNGFSDFIRSGTTSSWI